MDEKLTHLENLALALMQQSEPKETLPMTKDCKYCTHYSEVKCYAGGFKLNQDKIIDECYYSKGKRRTIESLHPMIDSGELGVFEFENIELTENEKVIEELREDALKKLFQSLGVSLADIIGENRIKEGI